MKKEDYYKLLKEYQSLIAQKQYNEYLCDRTKLDEVKATLVRQLKNSIVHIMADIIDEQKRNARAGYVPTGSKREQKHNQLIDLKTKIENEESISETDWTDSYYKPIFLFGMTMPQFFIVLLFSGVIYILCKIFAG